MPASGADTAKLMAGLGGGTSKLCGGKVSSSELGEGVGSEEKDERQPKNPNPLPSETLGSTCKSKGVLKKKNQEEKMFRRKGEFLRGYLSRKVSLA